MSPPPDAAARERALDVARSFIVKAPAGSGKTSLLVARYLALLAVAERPEEVVAITFTRKATAEMRARVLDALGAPGAPPPGDGHAQRLHALAAAVAARDRALGWQLRDNPQRLAIQTIDALCASLARRLPVLSGLGGALAPVDDALPLYRDAARRTLAMVEDTALGASVVRVLDHLDGNVAAFEDLLAQMLARRDQWMRHLAMDDPESRRRELENGLREVVEAALVVAARALPAECAGDLAALAAFAAARAAALGVEPALHALAGCEAPPGPRGESLAAWRGLAQLLLTADGALRRRPLSRIFSARETRAEYDRMAALLESLAGSEQLVPALHAVRALPAPHYDEAQWALLLDLFLVLRLAVASLRVEFAQRGACDFAELVTAASQALGEEQAPTDLALALDYRIRHLLVDEFQDTSVAHFEVVRKLTAGWTDGDGRTLFLVGDPMQSIYRFREAEVGLFLGCFQGALDTVTLEPLALAANFRSQAGLVDWVNDTFRRVLPVEDDPVRAAAAFEPSRATRDALDGPAVTVHAARDEDEVAQAARVADTVDALRRESPGASVAVLLRARGHAPAIVAALKARGLRWRGVDLEPLFGVPAVQDLHALCSALLHPLDRVSWLAVLRAPWCGLTLDDLEALAGDAPRAPIPDLLAHEAWRLRLSDDGGERLARVAPLLGEALERVGRDPLARLVARTWCALGGPACLDGARLEDARRYLALIAELDRDGGIPDPDELARRASGLYAAPDPGAADVELMTIHKAKGLEFDAVLLPALERGAAREARSMLAWSQTAVPGGGHLLLAPLPPPEGEDASPINAFVRSVEQQKRSLETARLLYVACTRARSALHLFASVGWNAKEDTPRAPRGESLLAHLWPAVRGQFAALAPGTPGPGAAAARAMASIARLPSGWPAPSPPRALPGVVARAVAESGQPVEFEWAGETARHVGVVAHALLRRVAEEGAERWDAARVATAAAAVRGTLEGLGVADGELDAACAAVVDALERTLSDPRGRWLLDPGHADARSEYALSGVLAGAVVDVVLDRTFVDGDGVRWIVDYKTGSHAGGGLDEFLDREQQRYRGQLERYARLIAALDPRPIRLALYFPSMAAWREWSFSPAA